jgi:hypothetical protein
MPDDCPVDDEARRALRDLARRAEWRGQAGAAGAALDARTLRELGRRIEVASAQEADHAAWSYRASEQLAAYCRRAQPDWTPEQVAELSRLREEAVIALAPGPGESDAEPERTGRGRILSSVPSGPRNFLSRRPVAIALGVGIGLVLIAVILLVPHFIGSGSNQTPVASASSSAPPAPTTAASTAAPTPSQPATPTSTATTSTSASASAPPPSAPATSPSASSVTSTSAGDGGGGSTSSVTKIQMTTEPDQSYPEVLIYGTITTSGTGDVTVYVSVSGSSGAPQVTSSDDSGQTSYALSQTIYLSQWCGQGSVRLTVSSGSVSQSATVPVSGC